MLFRSLFLEKTVKANEVVFIGPNLFLKGASNLQPEGPVEEIQILQTNNLARVFEIGRTVVKQGSFSYNGQEDRKASYFSFRDIDFNLVNAVVRIPEKGGRNGLIRFDSLQLKVFPLRAVIADSTYALEARSLDVHSYPADIIVRGIKVTPLKARAGHTESFGLATITIPELRIGGFYFDKAIFNDQWLLNTLYADHPEVSVEIRHPEGVEAPRARVEPAGIIRVPPFMKSISVSKVSVTGANAALMIRRGDKTSSYSLKDIMIDVAGFRVDSATRANPAGTPLFNADNITMSAPGFSWMMPDSMYTFSIGRFGFSTRPSMAFVDSLAVTPKWDRIGFSRKAGHETDRLVLTVPRITVTKPDFRGWLNDRNLAAARVDFDGPKFEAYRDKRFPVPDERRPLMPGRAIAGINTPVCIDTIAFSNGYASYDEQTGDEPGRIFFDRINATLTGFKTHPGPVRPVGCVEIHATSRLMGTADIDSWFRFKTGLQPDTFTVRATIGKLDLTEINPMLTRLTPYAITRGTATNTTITGITGSDSVARGNIDIHYDNLAIKINPETPGAWAHLELSVLTGLASFIFPGSNPGDDGKLRHGVIYFERNPSGGFFNFLWKSVLSGIKSSAGINSKKQKAIIKRKKKQKNEKNHS